MSIENTQLNRGAQMSHSHIDCTQKLDPSRRQLCQDHSWCTRSPQHLNICLDRIVRTQKLQMHRCPPSQGGTPGRQLPCAQRRIPLRRIDRLRLDFRLNQQSQVGMAHSSCCHCRHRYLHRIRDNRLSLNFPSSLRTDQQHNQCTQRSRCFH